MADPIQLETVDRSGVPVEIAPYLPEAARSIINSDQLQDLITLIASSNTVILPEGKTWADVKGFLVNIKPNGTALVNTRY